LAGRVWEHTPAARRNNASSEMSLFITLPRGRFPVSRPGGSQR
jgi:hypothetical protein